MSDNNIPERLDDQKRYRRSQAESMFENYVGCLALEDKYGEMFRTIEHNICWINTFGYSDGRFRTSLHTEYPGLAAKILSYLGLEEAKSINIQKSETRFTINNDLVVVVLRDNRGDDCHRAVVRQVLEWCGDTPAGVEVVRILTDDEDEVPF